MSSLWPKAIERWQPAGLTEGLLWRDAVAPSHHSLSERSPSPSLRNREDEAVQAGCAAG